MGPIFETGTRGALRCSSCRWKLLRDDGHWLGGIEINMLLSLLLGIVFTVTLGSLTAFNFWTAFIGGCVTLCFSAWFFQRSRALFYALDYWFDPEADDPRDDGGDWRDKPAPERPGPGTPGPGARPLPRPSPGEVRVRPSVPVQHGRDRELVG